MRRTLALLTSSKKALVVMTTAAGLAVAATGVGYASMSKSVTLSVDGHTEQVSTMGDTVGEVLNAEDIPTGRHDVVVPGLSSRVQDGTEIAVKYGRPFDVTVDGKDHRYWVTATDVAGALDQVGLHVSDARLSLSRSAGIGRKGLDLAVITPKKLTVKIAGHHAHHKTLDALTVAQALRLLDVKVGKYDQVKPGLGAVLHDGDRLVFTNVRKVNRTVTESIGFDTVKRADGSMYSDQSTTVRSGKDGSKRVSYRITYENGHIVSRNPLHVTVLSQPVDAIVKYGTKSRPAPAPTTNYAAGSTVWDKIAQCESGGNWAANTGNGYYGGLQFSLSTWHAYGGTGYPNQHSRAEQIAIATKVRNASGGYGAWPVCGAPYN
ncbi:MAG TPA: transglycosylase family protein [Nocardioidaceae bacterium]|nr:transglycosylase family protein [Nocardioidaceae bacterium]